MECLDCIETTARLHLYIDRELNAEEIVVVQQHLETCPHCECRFHFDMRVKMLIHERCTIVRAPEHLREAVLRFLAHGKHVVIERDGERELKADLTPFSPLWFS
jgi:mycothiol system anti-sigma-R factor